jgi:drug/metabolite transporter (DMT)-like permease
VGCFLLTIGTVLARQLSENARGMLVLLLALTGSIPALSQAVMLHPLIADLHGKPVWPGWGFVTCAIGFLILLFTGLRRMMRS